VRPYQSLQPSPLSDKKNHRVHVVSLTHYARCVLVMLRVELCYVEIVGLCRDQPKGDILAQGILLLVWDVPPSDISLFTFPRQWFFYCHPSVVTLDPSFLIVQSSSRSQKRRERVLFAYKTKGLDRK